jgi:hypothetical protein
MAKIIRMAVHSDVQQNSGMRSQVMPGQRNLYSVQATLMPTVVLPIEDSVTAQIQ